MARGSHCKGVREVSTEGEGGKHHFEWLARLVQVTRKTILTSAIVAI